MADPRKERIAQDLLAALEQISKTRGYYTDAGTWVSRRRVPVDTWNKSRGAELFVFCGGEEPVDGCIGSNRARADFAVLGYISAKDIDRAVVLLEADVKKAVLTDPSRGGLAGGTVLAESRTDYQELVQLDVGVVGMRFEVEYDWTLASL